jgi:hypothetical protein
VAGPATSGPVGPRLSPVRPVEPRQASAGLRATWSGWSDHVGPGWSPAQSGRGSGPAGLRSIRSGWVGPRRAGLVSGSIRPVGPRRAWLVSALPGPAGHVGPGWSPPKSGRGSGQSARLVSARSGWVWPRRAWLVFGSKSGRESRQVRPGPVRSLFGPAGPGPCRGLAGLRSIRSGWSDPAWSGARMAGHSSGQGAWLVGSRVVGRPVCARRGSPWPASSLWPGVRSADRRWTPTGRRRRHPTVVDASGHAGAGCGIEMPRRLTRPARSGSCDDSPETRSAR